MNQKTNTVESLGQLYVTALKSKEASASSVTPTEQIELLSVAFDNSQKIIENLALLTAALDANLLAVFRKLDTLGEDQQLGARVVSEFADLVALKQKVLDVSFADERNFANQFQKMVQDTIIRNAGLDPEDVDASNAYLHKVGRHLALAIPDNKN